jgi:epoxyqueuosine reductase QueG
MATVTTPEGNLEYLRLCAAKAGIDILSSAALGPREREHFHESIREIASSLGFALVLGVPLSDQVLATIAGRPNWTYFHHYRTVNVALDQAALSLAAECRRMGGRAFPVPASQIMDWEKLRAHVSHRELGALAGLGWRGRNNLLVNPRFGSQVRYTTVLTDVPLPARGAALDEAAGCGACHACHDACPARAIGEEPADFNLDRCAAQIRRFAKSEKLNTLICGVCIRACGMAQVGARGA